MKNKIANWSKKWWFWVIIAVLLLGIISSIAEGESTYTIVGGELGDYGKEIILNSDSDLPTKKLLYKLPAGTYTVTTTFDKIAGFYVVKDKIVNNGEEKYPEELNYMSEQYKITAGLNDYGGTTTKSVDIELKEDESILINGTATYIFKKIN